MARATLQITLPEDVWIAELTRANPEAEFRVLAATPGEHAGIGLVEITAADPAVPVREMRDYRGVSRLDVLQTYEHGAIVQFETPEPLLLLSVREAGVPLELPITIRDGTATVEVTASRDRLSEFGRQLETFGMSFDVRSIRETVEPTELLTEEQRRLIVAAAEAGYYDTPRECTLTELAAEVDRAKSTVSETLHRAEGKIVREFVEGLADPETRSWS